MSIAQSRPRCSTAAPSARFAAGVGGTYRKHDCHIILVVMLIIGGHALLRLLIDTRLRSVHPN
jgi:hypothetical protein